jgi:hypothetical protein
MNDTEFDSDLDLVRSSSAEAEPAPRQRTISEKEAFFSLEKHARRWFIATLSNEDVDWPIRAAMPDISVEGRIYHDARKRVRDLYKNWKNRTLQNAEDWFTDWMEQPLNEVYIRETDFDTLRDAVTEAFTEECLFSVFPWAVPSISFSECTHSGKEFLKCMQPPF